MISPRTKKSGHSEFVQVLNRPNDRFLANLFSGYKRVQNWSENGSFWAHNLFGLMT